MAKDTKDIGISADKEPALLKKKRVGDGGGVNKDINKFKENMPLSSLLKRVQ